ncbi:MAG: hypothetical protein K8L91_00280 [Anaerolineae bacterium]|nr:hypothetical protein [Anaerolineae bacterium]
MKRFCLSVLVLMAVSSFPLSVPNLHAQENSLPYATFAEFQTALDQAVASGDIDPFWETILATGQMPFIWDHICVFLYRGDVSKVEWRGDFSGWESTPMTLGEQQGDTDLWMLVKLFPLDARLDYKIVLNDSEWILDPLNPYQQLGGFGPNSELRMPEYVYPVDTIPRDDIEKGTLSEQVIVTSSNMGNKNAYRVYTPADYANLDTLPVIYVTDGHEYANDQMGSMVTVLDNLIAESKIRPVVAVFIDPRNPDSPTINRRESQYITNSKFGAFLAEELVPIIDMEYKTDARPEARAILGTSLGGLNSAYMGLNHSDVFGLLAIQSPALWVATRVIDAYEELDRLPLKIFMSQGSFWDDIENTRRLRDIFEAKGYPIMFIETPDGHSWGNWRALLDDLLIYFFGNEKN